jgi:hypothetical protein
VPKEMANTNSVDLNCKSYVMSSRSGAIHLSYAGCASMRRWLSPEYREIFHLTTTNDFGRTEYTFHRPPITSLVFLIIAPHGTLIHDE